LTAAGGSRAPPAVAPTAAPQTLVDLFEASVAAHGPRPLFVTKEGGGWSDISYTAFARQVDDLRGGLASLGIGRGDGVGIIANNRVEWAAAAYACYGLGAVFVPMYESQRDKEWAFIVRDSGLEVLLVAGEEINRRVADLPRSIATLTAVVPIEGQGAPHTYRGLLEVGARRPAPVHHPAAADIACLLYTSGTTAEPKGVILSHGNIVSNVLALSASIPLSPEYRTLSFLPWAHAFGHTVELHCLMAAGASLGIAESVERLADNLTEVRPLALVAVPRLFTRIYGAVTAAMAGKPRVVRWLYRRGLAAARRRGDGAALGPGDRLILALADRLVFAKLRARFGGRLRFAVSGAAALAREAAELMDALGITVYEGYGLTETSPVVTANVPGARKLGSVGRPLPGVRVVIDRSVAAGHPDHGEIVVYGPNVMQGYHNRPDETRAMFTADGGLRTGDLGYLDGDGYLTITGRLKEQYKLENGKYVVPAPLEERLKLSPFIANVMVHGDGRPHNVALVVPDRGRLQSWAAGEGLALPFEQLLRHPRTFAVLSAEIERLSDEAKGYERIAAFALIAEDFTEEAGMLTPSLKLKRRNVLLRWGQEIERLYLKMAI
jgi:long-chain acyl-CoA synthetase